jgi:lipoyl(octanoyl) transferase
MRALWLGSVDFTACWQLQRELAELRCAGRTGDLLLLLEHPPTITLGRGSHAGNVLASPSVLDDLGITLHNIDRGGDVTYHGPGQLVGYPIIDLSYHRRDLHWYLREMEEAIIQAITAFDIIGSRFPPHTGVWIGSEKVAAIGVKVSRWVTTHGFALNVGTDLRCFDLIVPCGIHDYGVTSLSKAVGRELQVADVLPTVVQSFTERFAHGEPCHLPGPTELSENSQRIFQKALDVTGALC